MAPQISARDFGAMEQSIEHLTASTSALRLSVDELRVGVKALADRITEIETKFRIGRALGYGVMLLTLLAGYGLKDAVEAFIAVARP